MERLINRIYAEQKEYLARVEQMPPREIISKAYEICWREELICLLESTEFDDDILNVLLNTPHLLDILYDEWLSTDVSVHDMLADVIRDFAREEMC